MATLLWTLIGIRSEWCKSEACCDRWVEEVELLLEERKRILCFFLHMHELWKIRGSEHGSDNPWMLPGVPHDPVVIAGRRAYAASQACMFKDLHAHFQHAWRNIDAFVATKGVGVELYVDQEDDGGEEDEESNEAVLVIDTLTVGSV